MVVMAQPALDTTELVDIFLLLEKARTRSDKLDLLLKAKIYILNRMSKEQIRAFFVGEALNFEHLFSLDIWTKSLDGCEVEFVEPYDIVDRIFDSFDSLDQLIEFFHKQIIFLLDQSNDEKSKHICVKHVIRLSKNLGKYITIHLIPLYLIESCKLCQVKLLQISQAKKSNYKYSLFIKINK
jgi:hypothetical protein